MSNEIQREELKSEIALFFSSPEDISSDFTKDDVREFYESYMKACNKLNLRGLSSNGEDEKLGLRISFTRNNCRPFVGASRRKNKILKNELEFIDTEGNVFIEIVRTFIQMHSWNEGRSMGGRYFFKIEKSGKKGVISYRNKKKHSREILSWDLKTSPKVIRRKSSHPSL